MGHPLSLKHAGFFVIRTPLLSIDELLAWGAGVRGPTALPDGGSVLEVAIAADRDQLTASLRAKVMTPGVREAIFLASPSLDEAVSAWLADTTNRRAENVTAALFRYFTRMASRPTPFGLFATSAVGTIVHGAALRFEPGPELTRHSRLDMYYVSALAEALERRPETRMRLRFFPNTSLYELAGQLRYIETRIEPETRDRRHDLVALASTDALRDAVARAAAGATPEELAQAIAAARPEVSLDAAAGFIDSLIDSRLLVSELSPAVTGPSPLDDLISSLERLPSEQTTTDTLRGLRDAMRAMDRDGIGLPPARYRTSVDAMRTLPAAVSEPRYFQVDLYRSDAAPTLGASIVAEVEAAVRLLARIGDTGPSAALAHFRQRFEDRYGLRTVPLVEVLDEEVGIGFGMHPVREPTPLLDGIELERRAAVEGATFDAHHAWKLQRLLDVTASGDTSWSLTDRDVAALAREPRLPGAFAVIATLVAASPEAVAGGDSSIFLRGLSAGAQIFGRFCHGDPALRAHVEAYLRAEEARHPSAVFAEIVHLPRGRLGNILCRPVLRSHEIPYLARPAVDASHVIPISDLLVSLERHGIVLRSRRLGCEVIPRLTSAHSVAHADLPIYRFLTALDGQGGEESLAWSWGPLASARKLPRVECGRVVLAPARWRFESRDVTEIVHSRGAQRFRAACELRRASGLPRWVSVGDGDQQLALDLDNVLAVDAFAELARQPVVVRELYPPPELSCVVGDGGRYRHEIVVPFVRTDPAPATVTSPEVTAPSGARSFAPGSEWLTLYCFGGKRSVDRVLTEIVSPLLETARERGTVDRWFFVRYGSPSWHVRLRFRGAREGLLSVLLPELHDRLAPLLETATVSRVECDTYEREIERYGGLDATLLVEDIFFHDSEAALSIVEMLEDDEGADARWRLALRGMHDLLVDFGLDTSQRLALVSELRSGFGSEHRIDVRVERQLGERFRAERQSVAALLAASAESDHPLAPGIEALTRRSAAVVPLAARLADLERRGALSVPRTELLASLLHMHANRMLLGQHRAQEVVLHDLLKRHYASELARARSAGRP